MLILVSSLCRYTNPTSPTYLDPLHIPQRLLSNILLDLPRRKRMSLREDFFHLESITICTKVTHVISIAYLFECSSRRLREHEEDVDKGRSVERREDKVLQIYIRHLITAHQGEGSHSLSCTRWSRAREGPHMLGECISIELTTSTSNEVPRIQLNAQFVAVESETALARIRRGKISAGYVHDTG